MGGATVRVATFNIQHARRPDGEVDVALLARSCAALDADVLALQEVDVGMPRSGAVDQSAAVAEVCGLAVVFGEAIAVGDRRYGNAVLARGRLDDVDVLFLPPQPTAEPRSAIVARVSLDDGSLVSVAATHLGLRGVGAEQLPVLLGALAARPGPRVLLGDLNLEPDVVAPLAEAAGFTMVRSDPTWPAERPRRQIDHVLLDGLVATAVVVPTVPVSDHRPLVAELAPS